MSPRLEARLDWTGSLATALLVVFALSLAGCGTGSSPTPSPGSSAGSTSSPGPSGSVDTFLLRATTVQALPPAIVFAWLPVAEITADLHLIVSGPVPAIFPGPLMPNLLDHQLTPQGWATIVDEARSAGLLSGKTDFTGGAPAPGSMTGRLQLVVDGKSFDLTGDPSRLVRCGQARCPDPPAGSPEAFAAFWARLSDIPGWLGQDAGPATPYAVQAVALLVGPPPAPQGGITGATVDWPLGTSLASFGRPISGGGACGAVTGADLASLLPALQAANQLTRWRDADQPGIQYGLTPRPVLPGEFDPCGVFGGG
jgi:hypothetical protein